MFDTILLCEEKEIALAESDNLVPLKKVLNEGYENKKLNLTLTNYSLILHSASQNPPYLERYPFDEIRGYITRKELYVLHFYIYTKQNILRKINFIGKSIEIILNVVIPKLDNIINNNMPDKEPPPRVFSRNREGPGESGRGLSFS